MIRRCTTRLLALALGAAPLATTATCDPRTGAFFFDRYDDGVFYLDDWGFFDGWFGGGCCGYYDDYAFFDGYYYY